MNTNDHPMFWWTVKVLAGTILVGGVVERYLLGAIPGWSAPSLALGQVLVVAGALVTLGHYVLMKRRIRNLSSPAELITDAGLFRYVRHPMYTGDLVTYTGLTLLAPGVLSLPVLVVALYALRRQARIEDRHMADTFGEQHARWRERTALLIPGLPT